MFCYFDLGEWEMFEFVVWFVVFVYIFFDLVWVCWFVKVLLERDGGLRWCCLCLVCVIELRLMFDLIVFFVFFGNVIFWFFCCLLGSFFGDGLFGRFWLVFEEGDFFEIRILCWYCVCFVVFGFCDFFLFGRWDVV